MINKGLWGLLPLPSLPPAPMIHWRTGALAHWHTGTLAHWHTGTLAHWHTGTAHSLPAEAREEDDDNEVDGDDLVPMGAELRSFGLGFPQIGLGPKVVYLPTPGTLLSTPW